MSQTHLSELHNSGATDGQVAKWDAALSHWIPDTIAAGGGGASSAVRAYRTGSNFPIPDINFTQVEFNAENYDTDNIHDNAVNPSRLTCQVAGTYIIAAYLTVTGAPTSKEVRITLNALTPIIFKEFIPVSETSILLVTEYKLAVGDYLFVEISQNSGGSIDVIAGLNRSWFAMASVGGSGGVSYSEDTMGDADKTWTAGMSTMRVTAAFTSGRQLTLPAANSLVAGSVIFLQSEFGQITETNNLLIEGSGADNINGASSRFFKPQANNSTGTTPRILIFITDGASNWLVKGINEYTSQLNLFRTYTPVVLAANTNRMPSDYNDTQVVITFNLACDDGELANGSVLVDDGGDLVFQIVAQTENNFNVTGIGIGGSLTIKQAVTFTVPVGSNYRWQNAGSGVVTVVSIMELTQ